MMAHYRIEQRSTALPGVPGEQVRMEPGPTVTALVRAGVLRRLADPDTPTSPVPLTVEAPTFEAPEEPGDILIEAAPLAKPKRTKK